MCVCVYVCVCVCVCVWVWVFVNIRNAGTWIIQNNVGKKHLLHFQTHTTKYVMGARLDGAKYELCYRLNLHVYMCCHLETNILSSCTIKQTEWTITYMTFKLLLINMLIDLLVYT